MSNYYDEIIDEIKELIDNKQMDLAYSKIINELNMPYIPNDVEEKLKELYHEVKYVNRKTKVFDDNMIDQYLKNNDESSLLAIDRLAKLNVRNYLNAIKAFLINDPNKYAAGLLIDILIEQNISDEIEFHKDDMVYHFIPAYLTCCKDNEAYPICYNYLASWLENINPSYLKMADQLLIQQMFLALPLTIEKDDALQLAYSILYKVCELMDDLETFEMINKTFALNYLKKYDIML